MRLVWIFILTLVATAQTTNFNTQLYTRFTSLQASINTLSSVGGGVLKILGSTGTINITTAVSVPSNVMIQCDPGATIKNTHAHGGVLLFASVTNSGVTGCALVASNGTPVYPPGSTSGNAITISGTSSFITISGNDISGHEFAGVFLNCAANGCDNLSITGNHFHDGTVTTNNTTDGSGPSELNSYGNVTNSRIAGNAMLSFNDYCLILDPNSSATITASDNIVEQNDCENKNYYGLVMYGGTASQTVARNKYQYNTIKNIKSRDTGGISGNNGGECIYAVSASDYDLIGNYCENAMQNRTGLVLTLGAISASNSVNARVLDNRVFNSHYHCYQISNGPTTTDTGVLFSRNKCDTATHDGVFISGAAYVRSTYNTIENTADDGMTTSSTSPYFTSDHDIVRSAGVLNSSTGVTIGGDYSSISYANVTGSGTDGILITGSFATVKGNISRNNSQSSSGAYPAFYFSGTAGITAEANIAIDDQNSPTQNFGYFVPGYFGTVITGCTNANPVVCTTLGVNSAPPTGTVSLGAFGNAFGATSPNPWGALNGVFAVVHASSTTFSVTGIDSTSFGALASYPGQPGWGYSQTIRLMGNTSSGSPTAWSLVNITSDQMPYYSSQNYGLPDQVPNAINGTLGFPNPTGTQGPYLQRWSTTLLGYACDFGMASAGYSGPGWLQCYNSLNQSQHKYLILQPLGGGVIFGKETSNGEEYQFHGHLNIDNLPTSNSGLAAGTLWNNSGVVNVAP